MKSACLGLATLFIALSGLRGETLAILGRNQVAFLSNNGAASGISENDAGQRIFLQDLYARKPQDKYAAELPVIGAPDWGKTVAGSAGTVQYETTFPQGFVGHLSLTGLVPNHAYILTFNGKPPTPGNNLLPEPVPGNPKERFYDFLRVYTDAQGSYSANLGVYLLPGDYHVRIYVKDTKDFKIVLYRDYFDFTVTSGEAPTAAK